MPDSKALEEGTVFFLHKSIFSDGAVSISHTCLFFFFLETNLDCTVVCLLGMEGVVTAQQPNGFNGSRNPQGV